MGLPTLVPPHHLLAVTAIHVCHYVCPKGEGLVSTLRKPIDGHPSRRCETLTDCLMVQPRKSERIALLEHRFRCCVDMVTL
jgi:hypothetical protein